MIDGARKYPVNILLMHHAVSDFMVNWEDVAVQDWFSNVGKSRGYSNGAINPRHEHPSRPGQLTYSMAQYNLREYTKDGNKYGYRITELMKRPMDNVAWHAGVWEINQRALGIETSGNFVGGKLPQKALMLVADTFRAHDKSIGGALNILGHKDIVATACPGQIYGQLPELIDMINNPAKWNEILWPNPKKPVPAAVRLEKPVVLVAKNDSVNLWDLDTNPDYKSVKTFKKGEKIDVVAKIDFNSTTYYQTEYSFGRNKHGINANDVEVEKRVEVKDSVEQVAIPFDTVTEDDPTIKVGETRVIREGDDGLMNIITSVTYEDGVEVKREVREEVEISPIARVIGQGTKESGYPTWFTDFWAKLIDAINAILGRK